jgi:hypothetical protein
MFKKFIEGLVFGCGFSISFVALSLVATFAIAPMLTSNLSQHAENQILEKGANTYSGISPETKVLPEDGKQFHELSVEEQIQKASVIALARFEKADDGKMKAIIKEFLKKDPNVVIHYNIGDEYPSWSYYPSDNNNRGDGAVIFFVGSPATMQMSVGYTGDRISGLADLPVELFKKKCKAPNA